MKELAKPKEVDSEQSRLKNISERLDANAENFSVAQADQKLAERLDIGSSVEYSGDEQLDKKTRELKKEINELLAERYHTSPTFEELRSKSKINHLSTLEQAQYAVLSRQYPERAKISPAEQRRTNMAYADAKKYKLDFQIMEALRFYRNEYETAKAQGESLSPRESDLYDKLSGVYAEKIKERADDALARAEELLWRL